MEPARVSLFFPVYRDEATAALMIAKSGRS